MIDTAHTNSNLYIYFIKAVHLRRYASCTAQYEDVFSMLYEPKTSDT